MSKQKQNNINDIETDANIQKEQFDYQEYVSTIVDGFLSGLFSDGIISDVDAATLQKYFANPDNYQKELGDLAQYFYISNGDVFQLFDLARVLPTLNYKLNMFDKSKNYEKHFGIVNKILYKVKHKSLTRDIISQVISTGTLTGIWLGDMKNPYLYLFDDQTMVFPAYRRNGDWVVQVDMAMFDAYKDKGREIMFENLKPYITKNHYNKYLKDKDKYQYVELPQERTIVIRTHALKRNQSLGTNWSTTGLYEIIHKKKLKDLEKAVANKIINAIAVLTVGSEKNPEYANAKLNKAIKRKVHTGVKTALDKNETNGVTVITIPEYANLAFPDMKSDALQPEKFNSINSDILSAFGISPAMVNGESGNYASAKINLDVFYKRIGALLEDVESEVYGKLFNLILPSGQKDNIQMLYDKEPPLTLKEKVDILFKLHSEGFAVKPIIDALDGVDFTEYIEQSLYELETMKLQDKIKPYQTSYTNNGDINKPSNDNSTNDLTNKDKTNNGNATPSPS